MSNRRRMLALLASAGLGTVAGCGFRDRVGSSTGTQPDEPDDTPTDPAKATPTATLTPTPSPSSSPTPTDTPTPSPAPTPSRPGTGKLPEVADTVNFGRSIDVSRDGSTVVVGDDGPEARSGSVYVFTHVLGAWRQAELLPDDGDEGDGFGRSVAVTPDGTTVVVGADSDENPNGRLAGSAYVFTRTDGKWRQRAKLAAAAGDTHDSFGEVVDVTADGRTAIIGAPDDDTTNGNISGSASVFSRADGEWRQRVKLLADDGDEDDNFGASVAVSADGSTAVVGANNDEHPNGRLAGSAYVFVRTDGGWYQQAKLTGDEGKYDRVGQSVAVSGDGRTVVVGAPGDKEPNGTQGGSASVFTRSGGEWRRQAKLAAPDDTGFHFGDAVSLSRDGHTAVIGANYDEKQDGTNPGSAHVFTRSDGEWHQRVKLTGDDGGPYDKFAEALAVSGDGSTAVVGAYDEDSPAGRRAGSAYVFSVADDG